MKNKLELIVVIPVFNEEQIVKTVITNWLKTLKKINFKMIIINDCSTDKTKDIIKSIITKRIILINKKNSGHGPTVAYGYKALKYKPKYIFKLIATINFILQILFLFGKKKRL